MTIPLRLINAFAGIVAGIWLAVLGKWALIGLGFGTAVGGLVPHDMVAGAYIACAAGAVLADLDGNPIDLEQALLRPAKNKLSYALARTETLARQLRSCLVRRPRKSA